MSHARPSTTALRVLAAAVALVLGMAWLIPGTSARAASPKPTGLSAVSTATTSVRLTWKSLKSTPAYRIKYDDNAKLKSPAYAKSATSTAEITGLKPGRTYWFKVRALNAKGVATGPYGATIKVTTRKAGDFALLSPTGLAGSDVGEAALTLSWAPRDNVENYRIRWATNAKRTDEAFLRVVGTSATLTDLSPGITYYFSVRAITPEGANLSQYSPTITVKTAGKASFKPPTGLTVAKLTGTGLTLSWKSVAGAPNYRIKYDATPWTASQYAATSKSSHQLTGLKPKTTYHLKVRILAADGSFASDYSTTITATTPAEAAPLRVASYNVRCHNCSSSSANEKPWSTRRDAVISTIEDADPDVLGLQEAQQSWLYSDTGKKLSLAQFEDLANRLGSPWALVNKHRNNCVKSTTPTNCTYQDRGASKGTKIIYRTDRLTLLDQGATMLSQGKPSDYERYVAWAIFRQKETGREFFFADIHLEPDNDSGSSTYYWNIRKTQASDVVAAIRKHNPDDLPVVLVGDPASNKFDTPSNAPYDVFVKAGLVDPLGNAYRSTTAVNPTVEKRINTNYNSFNAWERFARRSGNVNGTYTDYIFTSPMRVSEWETVVKVDANNNFVGVIPSDHNLIRATVWLP